MIVLFERLPYVPEIANVIYLCLLGGTIFAIATYLIDRYKEKHCY